MPGERSLSDFVGEEKREKPLSFKDAVEQASGVTDVPLTAADESALDDETEVPLDPLAEDEEPTEEEKAKSDEIPEWVIMPKDPNFKIPPGRQLGFLRLRGEWTDTASKGDRQCIVWALTDADEKLALKRTQGDSSRFLAELTKQMIRAVDGQRVDWAKGHSTNVNRWWNEVGAKCRKILQAYYHKTHSLEDVEIADFFANCVAVRTAVGGG